MTWSGMNGTGIANSIRLLLALCVLLEGESFAFGLWSVTGTWNMESETVAKGGITVQQLHSKLLKVNSRKSKLLLFGGGIGSQIIHSLKGFVDS